MLASLLERLGIRPRTAAPAPIIETRKTGPMPTGPVPGSKLTDAFVREVGRFAYLWAWPLVNVYNRYWTQDWVKTQTFLVGGVAPIAPINRLGMLTGYNQPGQRYITCPAQDLIYGFGVLDLAREPWWSRCPISASASSVFQATDQRTDAFSEIGSMYGIKPGFYLLVGPGWNEARRRTASPRCSAARPISAASSRACSSRRQGRQAALQPLLRQIMAYPLSEFDGTMKEKDWSELPSLPWTSSATRNGDGSIRRPSSTSLPQALDAARRSPARRRSTRWCARCSMRRAADRSLREALRRGGGRGRRDAWSRRCSNSAISALPLPHNWTTVINSAEFGTDYLHPHRGREVEHLHQPAARDALFLSGPRSATASRLTGAKRYTVTFSELPPVKGFWSITLYDQLHFFAPNEIDRFSLGTKSKRLPLRGRRLARHLCAEGQARRRPGVELAAGARRRLLALYPGLLAA